MILFKGAHIWPNGIRFIRHELGLLSPKSILPRLLSPRQEVNSLMVLELYGNSKRQVGFEGKVGLRQN